MARFSLVGVDPGLHGQLRVLCPDHVFVTSEAVEVPELVIADIGRVDADDVADLYPDVPIIGFTSHVGSEALRRARAAGLRRDRRQGPPREAQPGELIRGLLTPVE